MAKRAIVSGLTDQEAERVAAELVEAGFERGPLGDFIVWPYLTKAGVRGNTIAGKGDAVVAAREVLSIVRSR